jgi:hypothetical protein
VIDSVIKILIVIPTNVVKPPAEMNCPNTTANTGMGCVRPSGKSSSRGQVK